MTAYTESFFREIADNSKAGARRILPLLWTSLKPDSVIELGCGTGEWLGEARRLGAKRILGLDGAWVSQGQLAIPVEDFRAVDFERNDLPASGQRYDLAICLEVLEHIQREHADRLVGWLCRQAPVVLFSAAIPWQPGTNHVNVAWQSSWAGKFAGEGFLIYDFIRKAVWADETVPYYYRQNIFLAAEPRCAGLADIQPVEPSALDVVHPEFFTFQMEKVDRKRARSLKDRWRRFRRNFRGALVGS